MLIRPKRFMLEKKGRERIVIMRYVKKKYFFSDWSKLRDIFTQNNLFLFLDFDGTLAPIADTPGKAKIDSSIKKLLRQLSFLKNCRVAIVSGRSLKDIKQKVGLQKIIYVGNHGFEIDGPKINFKKKVSLKSKKIFKCIAKAVKIRHQDFPGIVIQDKEMTLSIHYRLVEKKKVRFFEAFFKKVVAFYLKKGEIIVNPGKKVYEVYPPIFWHKGKAVSWLLRKTRFFQNKRKIRAIYIGDDETDENAFVSLKSRALTIRVGLKKSSYARYYLHNVNDVRIFLERIFLLKRGQQ